jgi:hypothetical protein
VGSYTTELHGREAKVTSLPWNSDLVWVVFLTDGPLPDYDISGSEDDVSLGEFLRSNCIELDEHGIEVPGDPTSDVRSVIRTKISRDYDHVADALFWREKEACKKVVTRNRGALYLLEDKATGKWAVWLEKWSDFFSRTHISKSKERIAREAEEAQVARDASFAEREAVRLEKQKQDAARPSSWIILAVVAILIIWTLFRLLFPR